ncbi:hypothetical protein BDV93DRAFT_548447 [Ceratobasidium sp. AG-I]|nr:hypothetical protein BDV93DRAFT_548447 [Ceratobasidium sp. AG-I]
MSIHKYLLKRFKQFGDQINDGILVLGLEDPDIEDFRNKLRIFYASAIGRIRIAREFGLTSWEESAYVELREAITTSEASILGLNAFAELKAELSAVERIRLAREFNIPLWEEPAYLELCERDEPMTMSEAEVLGPEVVVHVAKIREKEQWRRGRNVDAAEELKVGTADGHADSPGSINVPATPGNADSAAPTTLSSDPDKTEEPEPETKEKGALESTVEQIKVAMSHPKSTAKNASEAVPTPSSQFSTLQDDHMKSDAEVGKWIRWLKVEWCATCARDCVRLLIKA